MEQRSKSNLAQRLRVKREDSFGHNRSLSRLIPKLQTRTDTKLLKTANLQPISYYLKSVCPPVYQSFQHGRGSLSKLPPLEVEPPVRTVDLAAVKHGELPRYTDYMDLLQDLLAVDLGNFWYCKRRTEFYDFELGTSKLAGASEYLMISSNGIAHTRGIESSFHTVKAWIREVRIFRKLKNIEFFAKFKKIQLLSRWKITRRSAVMTKAREHLTANLVLLDPEMRDSFIAVRERTAALGKFKLLGLSLGVPRSLKQFLAGQERTREKLAVKMQELETVIKTIVLSMCERSLDAFKEHRIITAANQLQKNRFLPFTEEAIARGHYIQLCRRIRLFDYLVAYTKISCVLGCLQKALYVFSGDVYKDRRRQVLRATPDKPVFLIKSSVKEGEIVIKPCREEISAAIDDSILRAAAVLLNSRPLLKSQEFSHYLARMNLHTDDIGEDFSFYRLVAKSKQMRDAVRTIHCHLNEFYHALEQESCKYGPFLTICKQNESVQLNSYQRKRTAQIETDLFKYNEQIEQIVSLPDNIDKEILRLNASKVKRYLEPSLRKSLEDLKTWLPQFTREMAMQLGDAVNQHNSVILGKCQSVEEFVKQRQFFGDLELSLPDLRTRSLELRALLDMLNSFSFTEILDLYDTYRGCANGIDTLIRKFNYFKSNEDTEKVKFSRELREDTKSVGVRVLKLEEIYTSQVLATHKSSPYEVSILLNSLQSEIDQLKLDCYNYNCWEVELELHTSDFKQVAVATFRFETLRSMWDVMKDLDKWQQKWLDTPFKKLKLEEFTVELNDYQRIAIESRVLEEQGNSIPSYLLGQLAKFTHILPIVSLIGAPELQRTHWDEINSVVGCKINFNSKSFTLSAIMSMGLLKHKDAITLIVTKARKEKEISQSLQNLIEYWESVELDLIRDKVTNCLFLKNTDEVFINIEEALVTVNTLLNSKYSAHTYSSIEEWYNRFHLLSDVFEMWVICQRLWIDLDKLFGNSHVSKKLPEQFAKYQQVDTELRKKMEKTYQNPKILAACTAGTVLASFRDWKRSLEHLQKFIAVYLDKQRVSFPRYFFLSNEELMNLTSYASNPSVVQKFFGNMFQNISELVFDKYKQDTIVGVYSSEKEYLPMSNTLKIKGAVEDWLKGLDVSVQNSLRYLMSEAQREYNNYSKKEFIVQYPTQIVYSVISLMTTFAIEEILMSPGATYALNELYENLYTEVDELTQVVRENLEFYLERRVSGLITLNIHNRDIVESLKYNDITSPSDFKWQQQLRFYWDNHASELKVKQLKTVYSYSYEFIGAPTRLVATPLTDRCWLTISTAFKLNLGTSPVGPAGTGKTETIKNMAKVLGKYCMMYNCSEQVTARVFGKFLAGLCYTGAWSCFDEFNRIDAEVLSIIAQQFRIVKNAKDHGRTELFLDDKKILLNYSMGFFVTMNLNYIGRIDLPDNIKALLRPVNMSSPDRLLIIEVVLNAEGFMDAKQLALKIGKFLKMADEQLSAQPHYNFGLRYIISVISLGAYMRRKMPKSTEEEIVIHMLKNSIIGKLIDRDTVLVNFILKSIFPSYEEVKLVQDELVTAVRAHMNEQLLDPTDEFVSKIMQLQVTTQFRFGLMIIGMPGTGKTTALKVLREVISQLHVQFPMNRDYHEIVFTMINPKALSIGELYGEMDESSSDWVDGVVGKTFREFANDPSETHKWILFDGPADSQWIENLNSVLDENMMLCLANQERIKLDWRLRVFFEMEDVASLTPATISRCGVVYMTQKALQWRSIFKRFLSTQLIVFPEFLREHLSSLVDLYMEHSLQAVKHLKTAVDNVKVALVKSFCQLFYSLVQPLASALGNLESVREKKLIEKMFLFSLAWSVGGNLDGASMAKFDLWLTKKLTMDFPRGVIYDSYVSLGKGSGEFKTWSSLIPSFAYNSHYSFYDIFVPSRDTVKYSELVHYNLKMGAPTYFTGNTGVGKSKIIQLLLNKIDAHNIKLSFTAGTTHSEFKQVLASKLDVVRQNSLSAPQGRRIMFFIDDLNLPTPSEFGSSQVLELLRTLVEHQEFFNSEKLKTMRVLNANYICCSAPPAGGRYETSLRLNRHLHVLNKPDLSEDDLTFTYKSIVEGFLQGFQREVCVLANSVVGASVRVFLECVSTLKPTPLKSFYVFSYSDIQRVMQGLMRASPEGFITAEAFIALWVHESLRTYYDILLEADRSWFIDMFMRVVNTFFMKSYTTKEILEKTAVFFSEFTKGINKDLRGDYVQVSSIELLTKCVVKHVKDSREFMNLVLFKSAIENLCKITRILGVERGHALLIGLSGAGKTSLVRLAAHLFSYKLYTIPINKNYTRESFRQDIRKLYLEFSTEHITPVVFLISDNQIIEESFLEDINTMLSTVDIANLFSKEDTEILKTNLQHLVTEKSVYSTAYEFFLERIRSQLHIVLAFVPNKHLLFSRMKYFPSLATSCSIMFIDPWPAEALVEVAQSRLQHTDVKLALLFVWIHQQVDSRSKELHKDLQIKVHVTPKVFLDLINCYRTFLHKQDSLLTAKLAKYTTGYTQIIKTNEEIQIMEENLNKLIPELEQKKQKSEDITQRLEQDSFTANQERERIEAEQREVRESTDRYKVLKEEAKGEVRRAGPVLEDAVRALRTLSQADISEIRTFANPPPLTVYTLEAIAILFEVPQLWDSIKKLLKAGFLEKLQNFPRDAIKPSTLKRLRKKIKGNPLFTPEQVGNQNVASKSLCKWVFAVENYARVAQDVKPKKAELKKMNAALSATLKKLHTAQRELKNAFSKVKELENELELAVALVQELDQHIRGSKLRIERARTLTESLHEESVRWKEYAGSLEAKIQYISGNIALAAAYMCYSGAFSAEQRKVLVTEWVVQCQNSGVAVHETFDFIEILGLPAQIRHWNLKGLPHDSTSVSNAIIIHNSLRVPLIYDPQLQAGNWLRQLEGTQLVVLKENESNFWKTLEEATHLGAPTVIRDIREALNPLLDELLNVNDSDSRQVKVGGAPITVHPDFRLYLISTLTNPDFVTDVYNKVNIVNFNVTREAMEEQLLSEVVRIESPRLEVLKDELLQLIANSTNEIEVLEQTILENLKKNEGVILDNPSIIAELEEVQSIALDMAKRISSSEHNNQENEKARDFYRPIAERGSLVYFVMNDLSRINWMYQFSIAHFTELFCKSISQISPTKEGDRVETLKSNVIKLILTHISHGLFSADKVIFSFLLSVSLLLHEDKISNEDWLVFTKGDSLGSTFTVDLKENPHPAVLSTAIWEKLNLLQALSQPLESLTTHFTENAELWEQWLVSDRPHIEFLSAFSQLQAFHKLLLIKAVRPEKSFHFIFQCIQEVLGAEYLENPSLSLREFSRSFSSRFPAIIILAPGDDAMSLIMRFKDFCNVNVVDSVSIGCGQEAKAQSAVRKGQLDGRWVVLENCHLSKQMLGELEVLVDALRESAHVHQDFRLFVTSLETRLFPSSTLQNCFKLTIQQPRGMKHLLTASLGLVDPSQTDPVYLKLAYMLSFLHAMVSERRKFRTLGWNSPYLFSQNDLETCFVLLELFLQLNQTFEFVGFRNIVGDIIYGGRITDELDRQCLLACTTLVLDQEAFETEDFKYTGDYIVPNAVSLAGLKEYVETLPISAPPQVFGMNENAQIRAQIVETSMLFQALSKTDKHLTGLRTEEFELERVSTLLKGIPEPLRKRSWRRTTTQNRFNALSVYFVQELDRVNTLISLVSKDLNSIKLHYLGELILNRALEVVATALQNNQIPEKWRALDPGTNKPLSAWIRFLAERVLFVRSCIQSTTLTYWLSAFIYPSGFLSALLQNYAILRGLPIETVTFSFEVTSVLCAEDAEELELYEDAGYVTGLFLEGCRWDTATGQLGDLFPRQLVAQAPIIVFEPIDLHSPALGDYPMPLYKTQSRANTLITVVEFPTCEKPEHWRLKGAALLCQLDE